MSVVFRLEWISSMSPFKYFVVTCKDNDVSSLHVEENSACDATYSFILLIKVVDVAVEDFDKEFDGHCSIHASVGDAEGPL